MKLTRTASALALALSLSACATVVRGTKQSFVIDSDPTSASAALSTGQTCTTPCSLKLKRKEAFTVHVTHDGYEPVDASVTSETRAGAIAGNILLGGIIGAGVDASNGSLKSLVPNPLHVKMVALAPPPVSTFTSTATSTSTSTSAPASVDATGAPGLAPPPATGAAPASTATPAAPAAANPPAAAAPPVAPDPASAPASPPSSPSM